MVALVTVATAQYTPVCLRCPYHPPPHWKFVVCAVVYNMKMYNHTNHKFPITLTQVNQLPCLDLCCVYTRVLTWVQLTSGYEPSSNPPMDVG